MTTYSRYWRKNRSRHEATELALSLRALRKVAFHIDKYVKPVFWKGMVGADTPAIFLDTEMIQGRYPIPFKDFDILVARVAFEGLASIEWTDWVRDKVISSVANLSESEELYSIMPTGRTPSGQAIMAAAMLLNKKFNRKQKKNMIIHITDGAANCGLPLSDAIKYCHRNNIEVYTIGCGCTPETRDILRETFPVGHVYFMKDIQFLSVGLGHLFKRRILNQSTIT